MVHSLSHFVKKTLAIFVGSALLCLSVPAQEQADYTFRVQSDLVLVNVTVKDKSGNFVRDLKPQDFTILEDNKPQKVVSFDVENIDAVATQDVAQAKPLPGQAAPATPPVGATPSNSDADRFKDRRLIVLFFDLSAMEPDEIDRAITSAEHYVDTQMAPADLVSIVSLGSSLLVNQDFTADHDLLKSSSKHLEREVGRVSKKARRVRRKARPTRGSRSQLTILNTTSLIPIGAWKHCALWPRSCRTCSRRNR